MAQKAELNSELHANQIKQQHVNRMEINLQCTNNSNSTYGNHNIFVDIAVKVAPNLDEKNINLLFTNFENDAACKK